MRLLYAVAVFAVVSVPLVAQDAYGRVVGTVADPQGAVISGAKITVTNTDTGVKSTTVSDGTGAYQVLRLPIGTYQVTAEQPGFRRSVTSPEKLEINAALRFDIRMEVGSVTEVVEVQAEAVGVETVNPTLGQSVTTAAIGNLPLNGRNVLDLAL